LVVEPQIIPQGADNQPVILFPLALAAVINTGLFVILGVLRPPPTTDSKGKTARTNLGGVRLSQALSLVLAMIVAFSLVFPTLSQSLWGDEQWSWRESIGGRFVRDATSKTLVDEHQRLVWEQVGWDQTVWRYMTTNHHFLFATTGRAANEIWQRATGAAEYEFSEPVLRSVPLICGLLGIALWARLAVSLSAVAGVITASLLAIHPWYLEYLTEARGYPLLFALLPALLLCLQSGCRTGSRKAWFGVAAFQAAAVYAWPGVVFALAAVQASVLVHLRRRKRPPTSSRSRWRWMVANVTSAIILFQLTAPCIPQVFEYLKEEVPSRDVGFHWIANEASWFALGCDSHDFTGYAERNPLFHTAESLLRQHPIGTLLALATIFGATIAGAVRWWRRAELGGTVIVGLGVSTIGLWAVAWATGTALYAWYFIYLLPFALMLAGSGIAWLAERSSKFLPTNREGSGWIVKAGVCVAAIAVLANVYRHPISAMREKSKDPRRESVEKIRPPELAIDDPAQLDIITAHCNQPALAYDPHGWLLKEANAAPDDPPGLVQLMRLADITDATLWVNVGGVDSLEELFPDVAEQLASAELFERVHVVHGLSPQFERHLYRYRGGVFDFLKGL
jgi:hypothetical protein